MFYNLIISILSLLIGLIIALLYYLFPGFFVNLETPILIIIMIAILSLGFVIYASIKSLEDKEYYRIWNIYAVCECGSILVLSSVLTITTALIALTIPWVAVTNLTFILMFIMATAIASMLLSLICFSKTLIRQSCF